MASPGAFRPGASTMVCGDDHGGFVFVLRIVLKMVPQFLNIGIRLPGRLQVLVIGAAVGVIIRFPERNKHHPWLVLFQFLERVVVSKGVKTNTAPWAADFIEKLVE